MPEPATETPATEQAPAATATPTQQAPVEQLGDGGKAALAAERAARKESDKKAKELAERLQAIEDKDKSELEKAQATLAKFEKDLAEERTQRLRLQAANDHKIPAEYLDLLTATDEAALKAQAEKLAKLFDSNGTASTPAKTPLPGQGTQQGKPATSVASGRELYKQHNPKT